MGVYTVNQTDGSLQRVAGGTLYADAPIGAIQSYGGVIAPAGWLICDGSAVSRTEYAELFAVIGINFGEGDGETTFGIPDLRECVPVGAGKNITKSIANHDRYDLGQFKDDALGTHNHPLVSVTTATFNTAGVPVGIGNNNTPTSATHGKQLGVNYIIKAKMVGVPADLEAQIDADYQKKDLTSAVEGETTVEDALGALSTNKQPKTLDTPLTIGGTNQTTVEGALGRLSAINQMYSKNFNASHDRYIKIATMGYNNTNAVAMFEFDIRCFANSRNGFFHIEMLSRQGNLRVNGFTDIDKLENDSFPALVISRDTSSDDNPYNIYLDTSYANFNFVLYQYRKSDIVTIADFSAYASLVGTEVFNSKTDRNRLAYLTPDIYSTSETITNKVWIDGKPIYRKVMSPTSPLTVSANDWVTINSVISLPSNIDQLLFAEIRHANNYSPWIAMARYVSGNLQVYSSHGIELYTSGTIIIEYTKTT